MPTYYCGQFGLSKKPATTHLFLAEGEAEVGFLDHYLQAIQPAFETTTILCFKGLGNIRDKTETLVKLIEKGPSGLDQIRGVGLIADSENNPSGQLDVAIQLATSLGFVRLGKEIRETQQCEQNGRRFRVALSPSHQKKGRLETLLLEEIAADPTFQCIAPSFACVEAVTETSVDEKAQVQMFISAKANNSLAGIKHAFAANIFDSAAQPYQNARGMVDYVLSAQ